MFSLDYTQCGCPRNTGINLSIGSDPYSPIPDHAINLVQIELCGTLFEVNQFFLTLDIFISWLNDVFVPDNNLEGYFFINKYNDLLYSNPEEFCGGSLLLLDLSDVVLTAELSSSDDTMTGFIPLMHETTGFFFIPENV